MDYVKILDTYTLEDILNYNNLSEAELLQFLVEQGYVDLPEKLPVDL